MVIQDLVVPAQRTNTSCGPASLFALYRHHGDTISHEQVLAETATLQGGGTLAVHLGIHALERGYGATLYSFNLELLDPTWFGEPGCDLRDKLARQAALRQDPKLQRASAAYARFLELGGRLCLEEISTELLCRYFERSVPLLAGVSATYLYRCARETDDGVYADLGGKPQGHFVVLSGYEDGRILVRDPWQPEDEPYIGASYWVSTTRLVHALLLGVLTYDGNLLALEPSGDTPCAASS